MYDRILLPTDGSEEALSASEHAFDIAATYDADLRAMFVVNDTLMATDAYGGVTVDQVERAGDEALDEIKRRARNHGIENVITEVTYGIPHQAIREYAADNDVDLIVMGTHGRTGVERYLLGSVTEKIVRTADVPVLTVRPEE
ncbi:universal stress protein [Halostella pelagica]|uniref:universal stress protein n=1 Tax=Halostella pelagica TaxID=2583824 RepID=UPI0010810AEE|nr:universal stress protein [Halostella pelagica]